MLPGFEEQTEPLTDYERDELVPVLVPRLAKRIGAAQAVTGATILAAMQSRNYKVNAARIRKLINHIRTNDLVPCLMATSRGYYVTTDPQELQDYADSLLGREKAIRQVRLKILLQRRELLRTQNSNAA